MSIASIPRHDDVPIAHWSEAGPRAHTVQFYGEDISLLKELSCFIGAALMAGDAAVVIATKAHRDGLTQRLQSLGFDTAQAFEQARYVPLDAAETLEKFMLDGMPDAALFNEVIGSVLGQAELDELLSQRDKINMTLQEIIDRQTDPWGIKVTAVEVKDVVLPDSMKRAMAGQAESERERRAKIINAEGEFQAAEKLVQAAAMISSQPIALQLRFLQTMKEISSEHNTTTILPVPIDLFKPFIKASDKEKTE